jgi:hypothetical protein
VEVRGKVRIFSRLSNGPAGPRLSLLRNKSLCLLQEPEISCGHLALLRTTLPECLTALTTIAVETARRPAGGIRRCWNPGAVLVFVGDGHCDNVMPKGSPLGNCRSRSFSGRRKSIDVYMTADLKFCLLNTNPFALAGNEASCRGCPVGAINRVGAAADS